jgi:O-antigen/teichoic acid export membrane protein
MAASRHDAPLNQSGLPDIATAPGVPASPPLRANFGWAFLGNAIYAAGQWGILSLIAKLGGPAMLGEYALALALTAPLAMLSHLNLRSVLATDASHRHPFRAYLQVRYMVSLLTLAAMGLVAAVLAEDSVFAWVVFLTGAGQVAETFSDLYYGALQREERIHRVGQSMMLRTLVSLVALGLVLWTTGDLLFAVMALACSRLLVFLGFDLTASLDLRQSANATPSLRRPPYLSHHRAILMDALPLGLILMLISLNTHLPRYAVQQDLGSTELGAFTAVVTLITVGSTLMNAMGQSAAARLARSVQARDLVSFRHLMLRFVGMALVLGALAIGASVAIGDWVLRWIYRPELALYQPLLVASMVAGTLSYVAIALGYGVTSTRVFGGQLPLFAASVTVCALASWWLVPAWGLYGAVAALALSTLPQIGGQLFLLRRALRQAEVAP